MFKNRKIAGQELAEKVERAIFRKNPGERRMDLVVIGLPRGGAIVAGELARRICCRLELIVAKKIPYPEQPEFAIGAVSSDGIYVLNPEFAEKEEDWRSYIESKGEALVDKCRNLESEFYKEAGYEPVPLADKIAVIVDDGVATGSTALAAIETARKRGARRVVMATPVISFQGYQDLLYHCDDVFVLHLPAEFYSVGRFYEDFTQVSNEEVLEAMKESVSYAMHSRAQNLGQAIYK